MRGPFVSSDRISLRPLEPGDASDLVRWLSDPLVTLEIDREPVTLDQELAFIGRVSAAPDLLASAIVLRETDRRVGWIDLSPFAGRSGASFGIVIGERDLWGQGIGTAATLLSLEIAFLHLSLERVELTVNASNLGGIRAYERAGFRLESVRKEAARVEGRLVDEWVMAIAREEWLTSRE